MLPEQLKKMLKFFKDYILLNPALNAFMDAKQKINV